jgi:hypothetical protein
VLPYDLDHDLSSSAAFEYFAAHGVQFGTQLIQNVGPLGWVQYSAVYAGYLHELKLVLGLLRAAALCGLVLWACTRFQGRIARMGWLLAFVALIPMHEAGEEWTYLFAYLSGLALLALPRGRALLRFAVLPLFFLAFLALIKHTLLFISLFIVLSVAHVAIFFHTSAFLALLFGLAFERPSEETRRAPLLGAATASLALTSAGLALLCALGLFAGVSDLQYRPARLAALWSRNLNWLVSPARRTIDLSRAQLDRELEFRLAWVQRLVGRAPIDFFGPRTGWLLLSRLEYSPRPMPITFAATNEFLLRRNEDFYRDPDRAPRFILCELMTIDNRLVALDDGLALGAILDNYHPVRLDAVWNTPGSDARSDQETPLLLERNLPARMRAQAERTLLETKEIRLGEALSLERFGDRWLWLEVQLEPSLLGRVRALLLRPAPVEMALDIEGREHPAVRKYVTSMGTTGFLISPLIETNRDLFDAYARDGAMEALERVRSVRFESDPKDLKFFEPRILARIYGASPPGRSAPARDRAEGQ